MERRGDQPPEGRLIEDARERLGLSQNKAAKKIGISGTRWRSIVYGEASAGGGIKVPVSGNAKLVARMAHIVGLSPAKLAEEGERADAAEELQELLRQQAAEAESSVKAVGLEVLTAYTPAGNRVLIPVPPGLSEEGRAKLVKWGIRMGQFLLEEESEVDDPTL